MRRGFWVLLASLPSGFGSPRSLAPVSVFLAPGPPSSSANVDSLSMSYDAQDPRLFRPEILFGGGSAKHVTVPKQSAAANSRTPQPDVKMKRSPSVSYDFTSNEAQPGLNLTKFGAHACDHILSLLRVAYSSMAA